MVFIALLVITLQAFVFPTFGKIDVANATREQLFTWYVFRDIAGMSGDIQLELANRYNQEYGRKSGKPLEFHFSKWEKKLYATPEDKDTQLKTQTLRNTDTLFKAWFTYQANRYESAKTKNDRKEILVEVTEDFRWWEIIYTNYLAAIDRPVPTPIQFAQEFDEMIDRFTQNETKENKERIKHFQSLVKLTFLVQGF
jgi:hypothetical protein